MTAFERCPSCGARVQADLPAGSVCPVCLFGLALEPASETGTSVPPSPDAAAAPPTHFAAHPLRVGACRILTVLGQGGMGVVYLAEQDQPIRRQVALKVIKLGMDTRAGARALRRRAAGAGADGPPAHRPGLRRRRDATRAGRTSSWSTWRRAHHRLLRPQPAVDPRAAGAVRPRVPGRAARPPEGDHPPRPQAVERAGRRRGWPPGAEDHRLRHRESDRPAADRARRCSREHGHADRHAGVHEPRAGRRGSASTSTRGPTSTRSA